MLFKLYIKRLKYNMVNTDHFKNRKKGSNGMAKSNNRLSPEYNYYNQNKYLNLSINNLNSCAGMAEWSTQSVVTRCPSGCVGSIPTASAAPF